MGEFPQGEFPPQGDSGATADAGSSGGEPSFETGGASGDGGEGEPGFETGAGAGGLPDMRDEPSFEDVLAGMEEAMNQGQASGSTGQQQGQSGAQQQGQGGESGGYGSQAGEGSQAGGGSPSGAENFPGSGPSGSGQGPLTPAEQVAILDGRLERGTGEFDAMILEEQERQREAARSGTAATSNEQAAGSGGSGSGSGGYGRDMDGTGGSVARSGSYGGGIGGVGGGQEIPQNTAKYPPPEDIPDGNDDDVVARQLREAAMREPDPAVREKLWDEYRKYKGIEK